MKFVKHNNQIWKRRILSIIASTLLVLSTVAPAFAASGVTSSYSDSGLLWLVNYNYNIPSATSYVPSDLRTAAGSSQKLRSKAADAMDQLLAGLKAAGHSVRLQSGYRSYSTQTYLFNTRLKDRQNKGMSYDEAYNSTRVYTAVPGTSEHQLGLAMDFSTNGTLSDNFANTSVGKWLKENSWRYGYILRYETSKISKTQIGNEPWHFRYVGTPHAQIMYEKNWCLEEYIEFLRDNSHLTYTIGDTIYEIYRTSDTPSGYSNVIDCSKDNLGGWIVTTRRPSDPWAKIRNHWSETAFRQLLNDDTISKMDYIDPDQPISRGQFATLYATILEPESANGTVSFSDVPASSPYYDGIRTVASRGFMTGNQGKFNPQRTLSRQEAAVSIAASIPGTELSYLTYDDTASIAGWAFQSIQKLSYHQIMQGSGGKFNPQGTLTWGQAAALIANLQQFSGDRTDGFDN